MLFLKVKKYFRGEDVEVKETQSDPVGNPSRSSHPGDNNIACVGYIDIMTLLPREG